MVSLGAAMARVVLVSGRLCLSNDAVSAARVMMAAGRCWKRDRYPCVTRYSLCCLTGRCWRRDRYPCVTRYALCCLTGRCWRRARYPRVTRYALCCLAGRCWRRATPRCSRSWRRVRAAPAPAAPSRRCGRCCAPPPSGSRPSIWPPSPDSRSSSRKSRSSPTTCTNGKRP